MRLLCVTRNLGRRTASSAWVANLFEQTEAPQLVLLQELPGAPLRLPAHIAQLPSASGQTVSGHCRSAILVDTQSVGAVQASTYVNPSVLGDYVALARLSPLVGRSLAVASVHASPNPLTVEHRELVDAQRLRRPAEAQAWYADVVVDELAQLRRSHDGPILVAGDFNEAYAWDASHDTPSSEQFFARMRTGRFVDATRAAWLAVEPQTQVAQPYQVDRIFGSADLRVDVPRDPAACLGTDDGASDHLPLSFSITL